MKRIVRIGDRELEVKLERDGDRLTARVCDRDYLLSVREAQSGVYSFIQADEGGKSDEAVVHEQEGGYRVRVRNRYFETAVERPGERMAGRSAGDAGGPGLLKAVMPGRVVRVLVEPGDTVTKGQGVLVIEAMKMENEMGSPKDGTVREVQVSAGDRVEAGARLAVIE